MHSSSWNMPLAQCASLTQGCKVAISHCEPRMAHKHETVFKGTKGKKSVDETCSRLLEPATNFLNFRDKKVWIYFLKYVSF